MRRRALSLALVVYAALVLGVHAYLIGRFVLDTALPSPWGWLVTGVHTIGGTLLVAHPIVERAFRPRWSRFTAWPAYVWMGATFYLLIGLWASDLVLFALALAGTAAARWRAGLVGGGAAALVLFGMASALRTPRVRRIEIALRRWPRALDGYRIVQISDVHIGSLLRRGFATRVVERCNALDADLLAVTGDLVDGNVRQLSEEVEPFRALRARDGVYFVTGNHEYYSGAPRWTEKLRELGMRVLGNESVLLGSAQARFRLAGVNDATANRVEPTDRHDLPRALEGWDSDTPLVLLAHHPATFERARRHGVDLQLSGHTHGGQLWPFGYAVRLQTPRIGGLYREGSSHLYVSRGTGFWGPPMRVLAPAEITEIVLKAAPAEPSEIPQL